MTLKLPPHNNNICSILKQREKREREERETMASAAATAAADDIEDEDQKRRRRKRRSLRRERSKIIGQIDIEIESNSSQGRYKQQQEQYVLSIELTNKNYDDAAEMCVNFCEERGLPMKIAPALALRLRAAYKKALIKQTMDSSSNSSVGGFEREREHAKTEGEEDKEEEEEEEVRREKVQLLTSNPADMAMRIAAIKKNNKFNKDDETTTATKANTTRASFQMVTPSNVGSWNPVASGEMTMQKLGANATRVVRREREREREEEEINGGGDLLEVIVVDEQQQQEQQRSHGGQFEFEEECASEAGEEEMLEFEITPTKQDYADSFARPSDWFVQDFEDKATLSAKKTNETFKTPSKKESDRGGSRGSGAAVATVAAAGVDGDDDSDTSLSEKIIHASPGFKDSLKMFEAMDASPKKKSSFGKSPPMTAPGFVSPMETKKPKQRYAPRDLNE